MRFRRTFLSRVLHPTILCATGVLPVEEYWMVSYAACPVGVSHVNTEEHCLVKMLYRQSSMAFFFFFKIFLDSSISL
jgi:hypothetical protein